MAAKTVRPDADPTQTLRGPAAYADTEDSVAAELGADASQGLSQDEADRRRAQFGPNRLEDTPPTPAWRVLLGQFKDVAVIALMVAAVVAVVLGELEEGDAGFLERYGDALAIALIVALNAIIGFAQERKAEQALRALRELGAPEAVVLREGSVTRVPAESLVQGDVILLEEGDRIPADARLIESSDLVVVEAALTGESVPSDKELGTLDADTPLAERRNLVFSGTHVVRGKAKALVVATGMGTEIGRIASLLGGVQTPDTPLQLSLRRFSLFVVIGSALLGALVLGIGMTRGTAPLGEWLLIAVSLAVAAIPEGLPAVTTIVLALGVQRMAKKNALVRRLSAVETLGSADIICTDKTGTLTQNVMRVRRAAVGGLRLEVTEPPESQILGPDGKALSPAAQPGVADLLMALGFTPAAEVHGQGAEAELQGDPTDVALLSLHRAALPEGERAADRFEVLRVLPFDRERGRATVVASQQGEFFAFTHGAAEVVLADCVRLREPSGDEREISDGDRGAFDELLGQWADAGLRVLCIAVHRAPGDDADAPPSSRSREQLIEHYERDLTLLGLVALADPPRVEVSDALRRAEAAGVRTVVITGDHPRTAAAIARELGILTAQECTEPGRVVTGAEVGSAVEGADQLELGRLSEIVTVVARATAEHKLRLVEALQTGGHVVAMTGDGVNDAPAIKASNIGVAMGRGGTDVTREAADMVLLDDNYATIVEAIAEGRVVYANIKRFIVFLFAVNWGLVLAVFVGAIAGWPALLTPTQILWINLITNGLPALALGMEPAGDDPMTDPPRKPDAALLLGSEVRYLLLYGSLIGGLGLLVFVFLGGPAAGPDLVVARTAAFTVLAFAPLFHALNSRARVDSVFQLGLLSNVPLLGAFAAAALLQALAVYVPGLGRVFGTTSLTAAMMGSLVALSASVWVVGEAHKTVLRWLRRRQGA